MEPSGQAPELDFFDFEPPESLILVMPPEIVYSFAQPVCRLEACRVDGTVANRRRTDSWT